MIRKVEIAAGILILLEFPFNILVSYLEPYTIGIVGGADGPTAIYISTPIAPLLVYALTFTLSAVLLLMPPRRKIVIVLSVLCGFGYAAMLLDVLISELSIASSLIDVIPNSMPMEQYMNITASVFYTLHLLLYIVNMSLLFRRGVRLWLKEKQELSSIKP